MFDLLTSKCSRVWIASFLPVFSFLCHSVLELRSGMGQMDWHTTAINKYYAPWGAAHNNTLLNKKTLLVDRWCNYYQFVHNCYTVCCCRNKDDDNTVGKLTAEKVGNICDWIMFTLWYIYIYAVLADISWKPQAGFWFVCEDVVVVTYCKWTVHSGQMIIVFLHLLLFLCTSLE